MATTQISPQTSAASKTIPFQFSLLTSLYAAGWLIALESLVDIYEFYFNPTTTIGYFIANTGTKLIVSLGLNQVYAFGINWWLPPLIIGGFLGRRLGRNGLLYIVLGVFVFLIVLHNFRGLVFRHNIFEVADSIRSGELQLPHPLFWDVSYFVAGLIGGGMGWASRRLRPARQKNDQTDNTVGETLAVRAGAVCVGVGLVEALVTRFVAQPNSLSPMQIMTHGYAALGCGLLIVSLPFVKDRWLDYDIF